MSIGIFKVKISPKVEIDNSSWVKLYLRLDSVKKTNQYYSKLSNIRDIIKSKGWETTFNSLMNQVSEEFKIDLTNNKDILPKLGVELQSRIALLMLGLS